MMAVLRWRSIPAMVRDRRGVSAVEFALVAPVLLLMIGGMLSVSTYLRARATIHNHAREAARGVALGYMTPADARTFAETNASRDLQVSVTATVDPATKGNPADPDVVVTLVIAAEDMARMMPAFNIITGRLSSSVVMRGIAE